MFVRAEAERGRNAKSLFTEAAPLAEHLLANQQDIRPLHGDVHHENLLYGQRGWLAIDAKGLLGDPAYDAANLFCNPLDRRDLCEDPARAVSLAGLLAQMLDRDERRILQYAFVNACLSAAWYMEDSHMEDARNSLAVAHAVRQAMS